MHNSQIGRDATGKFHEVRIYATNDELALLKGYAWALQSYKEQSCKDREFKAVGPDFLAAAGFMTQQTAVQITAFELALGVQFKTFGEREFSVWRNLEDDTPLNYWMIMYGLAPTPQLHFVYDEDQAPMPIVPAPADQNGLTGLSDQDNHSCTRQYVTSPDDIVPLRICAAILLSVKQDCLPTVDSLRSSGLITKETREEVSKVEARTGRELHFMNGWELQLLSELQDGDQVKFSRVMKVVKAVKADKVTAQETKTPDLVFLDGTELWHLVQYAQACVTFAREGGGAQRPGLSRLKATNMLTLGQCDFLQKFEEKLGADLAKIPFTTVAMISAWKGREQVDRETFKRDYARDQKVGETVFVEKTKEMVKGMIGEAKNDYLTPIELQVLISYAQACANFATYYHQAARPTLQALRNAPFFSEQKYWNLVNFEDHHQIDLWRIEDEVLRAALRWSPTEEIGRVAFQRDYARRQETGLGAEAEAKMLEYIKNNPKCMDNLTAKSKPKGLFVPNFSQPGELVKQFDVVNLKVSPFDPNNLDLGIEWAKKQFQRGSEYAAGLDLLASEDIIFASEHLIAVPTGICTQFDSSYVAVIKERSGMALKRWEVHGGVIDSDYRGEWKVILRNSDNQPARIEKGQKIAQVLFVKSPITLVEFVEHSGLLEQTDRGVGGFGSTGA